MRNHNVKGGPVIFDCLCGDLDNGLVVMIGKKGWGIVDTDMIARDPAGTIIRLAKHVSGPAVARNILMRGEWELPKGVLALGKNLDAYAPAGYSVFSFDIRSENGSAFAEMTAKSSLSAEAARMGFLEEIRDDLGAYIESESYDEWCDATGRDADDEECGFDYARIKHLCAISETVFGGPEEFVAYAAAELRKQKTQSTPAM